MAESRSASALLVAPVRGPAAGRRRRLRSPRRSAGSASVAREPGPRALVWLLGVESLAIGALDVLYVVLAVGVLDHGGSTRRLSERRVRRRRRARRRRHRRARRAPPARAVARSPGSRSGRRRSRCIAVAAVDRRGVPAARRWPASAARCSTSRAARCCSASRRPTRSRASSACSKASRWPGSPSARSPRPRFVALAGGRGAFVCLAAAAAARRAARAARSCSPPMHAVLPVVEIARLRALPIFAPLGAPALEALARALEPVEVPAGDDGDPRGRGRATASTSSPTASSTVSVARRARSASSGAATASARSRCCATCRARRP